MTEDPLGVGGLAPAARPAGDSRGRGEIEDFISKLDSAGAERVLVLYGTVLYGTVLYYTIL